MKAKLPSVIVVFASVFALSCTEPEDTAPTLELKPKGDGITFLEPTAGKSFKVTDTIPIIARCDYSKFASGLNFLFSKDSAKTWLAIKSVPPKSGIDRDTLRWEPGPDRDIDVKAGDKLLLQVRDYDKGHIAYSGFIHITP